MEPWAEEFDHQDPGFDPLEAACREARVRELNLHAWVNAVPGWKGLQQVCGIDVAEIFLCWLAKQVETSM